MKTTPPTPLALAILGLLDERPMHPYELSFHMRSQHMDMYIKLKLGSLYHTFDQLTRQGLVEPAETERPGRRPERTVYRLTEAGRDVFLAQVRNLIGGPEAEFSAFEAGLIFMHHLGRHEAAALLRERAQMLNAEIGVMDGIASALIEGGVPRLALIEAEHRQTVRRAQAGFCERIGAEIESGRLPWNTQAPGPRKNSGRRQVEALKDEQSKAMTRAAAGGEAVLEVSN